MIAIELLRLPRLSLIIPTLGPWGSLLCFTISVGATHPAGLRPGQFGTPHVSSSGLFLNPQRVSLQSHCGRSGWIASQGILGPCSSLRKTLTPSLPLNVTVGILSASFPVFPLSALRRLGVVSLPGGADGLRWAPPEAWCAFLLGSAWVL